MRPLHILTALLLVALLAGCGTTQHFVPPMPIPPGTAAGTIGVSWSSSRFIPLGLQGNFYLGVAGGNMLGVGFNNFVLPSSFTYVHYERISEAASFKSIMTSTGCMILLATLVILPLALAGPALGFPQTIYIAYLILPILILFTAVQLLRFGIKPEPGEGDVDRKA